MPSHHNLSRLCRRTRQICNVRKLATECHKLNSRLRQPLNPDRERSYLRRNDKSEPFYTALPRVGNFVRAGCTQDAQKSRARSSPHCAHFPHRWRKSFWLSEDTPSSKPKATAKSNIFQLTVHSPLMAHPLIVQDYPKLLPMRPSVFQIGCPEVQPYMGSRIDFLFGGSRHGSQLLSLLLLSTHSTSAFLCPPIFWLVTATSPCIDGTWLSTLVLRHLCVGPKGLSHFENSNTSATCLWCGCHFQRCGWPFSL